MSIYVDMSDGKMLTEAEYKEATRGSYMWHSLYRYWETSDTDLARAIAKDMARTRIANAQEALDKRCKELAALDAPPEPPKPAPGSVQIVEPCTVSKKCNRWFAKDKP